MFLNIRKEVKFWEAIGASDFTLSVINFGYKLNSVPGFSQFSLAEPPRGSALANAEFVCSELTKLLATGAVQRVISPPRITSALAVATNSTGKKRLILDLSKMNLWLFDTRFRYEDLSSIWYSLPPGGFLTLFDFRSGYHHIGMHNSSLDALGFQWNIDSAPAFFQFTALPFGLKTAPLVFSKVMRTLVQHWRSQGISVTLYLDDGIIFGRSYEECRVATEKIRIDLRKAGIVTAEEKCEWKPAQSGVWLGFEINLMLGIVRVSEQRLTTALERLRKLRQAPFPAVHDRQKVLGTLHSMHLVLGPAAGLASGAMQEVVATAAREGVHQKRKQKLADEELRELDFWLLNLRSLAVRPLISADECDFLIHTDASATGTGAILFEVLTKISTTISETECEAWARKSSTERELLAINMVVDRCAVAWSGKCVNFRSDSQAAVFILNKGSPVRELQKIAQHIFLTMIAVKAKFSFEWLPRENNVEADVASRFIDADDWCIEEWFFRKCEERYGKCVCDCFANNANAKTRRFFSRFLDHRAVEPDFFACAYQDRLPRGCLWLVPPVSLVARVIRCMKANGLRGILGCPLWVSQPYYPMLKSEVGWSAGVIDVWVIPTGSRLFIPGPGSSRYESFASPFSQSPFAFFLLDYSLPVTI